jgi:hypothetical protein
LSLLHFYEITASLSGKPVGDTFPTAKFVRPDLVAVVGFRDRDYDRADWVMSVRGTLAVKAVAVGRAKPPQMLFDRALVETI